MAPVRPRLSELPEELVSNISIKLGSDDVFAFRLTCKALEQRSFHEFANEYFSQKAIMLTTPSLKTLLRIVESERLRGYLHHIYIAPALFSDRVFKCSNGSSCVWQPTVRQSEAMHGYIEDQKSLKRTGRDVEMLTDAFSKLPALHGLTFVDNWRSLPKDVDRCGLASSLRKTNGSVTVIPQHPEDREYYMWKNHVWKTMLRAVANSGVRTLKSFATDLDRIKNPLCPDNLSLTAKTLDGLKKALRNVKTLNLQITSLSHSKPSEEPDTVKGAQVMQRLANAIPAIDNLDFAFSYSESSGILCQNFTANLDLSKLAKFNLDSMHIDVQSLGITICKLVNLEDLQLRCINLTEGIWTTILEAISKLQRLTHLHLVYLEEAGGFVAFRKPIEQNRANEGAPLAFDDLFGPDFSGEDDEGDEDFEDDESESDEEEDDDDLPELEEINSSSDANSDTHAAVDSDTDDSMPELEPQDATSASTDQQAPPTQPPAPTDQASTTHNHIHPIANHGLSYPFGPLLEDDVKTGRYVCLSGHEEILQQIPIFIKEHHIMDDDENDGLGLGGIPAAAAGAGGAAPPGGFNAFLNSIGAAFGMGAPTNVVGNAQMGAATFVPQMPPPPGGAANAGHGGHVTISMAGPFNVGGAAGAFPPPPPQPFAAAPGPPPPATNAIGGQANADAGTDGEDNGGWTDEE